MKITTVNYQKAFVIGPYLQERIGVEIEIDDTESPESALSLAKKIAEDWHKANNPQLEGMTITDVPSHLDLGNGPEPIQWQKEPEANRIEVLIKDIESETVLRKPDGTGGLLAWKMVAATNPALQAAFDKRKSEIEYETSSK